MRSTRCLSLHQLLSPMEFGLKGCCVRDGPGDYGSISIMALSLYLLLSTVFHRSDEAKWRKVNHRPTDEWLCGRFRACSRWKRQDVEREWERLKTTEVQSRLLNGSPPLIFDADSLPLVKLCLWRHSSWLFALSFPDRAHTAPLWEWGHAGRTCGFYGRLLEFSRKTLGTSRLINDVNCPPDVVVILS